MRPFEGVQGDRAARGLSFTRTFVEFVEKTFSVEQKGSAVRTSVDIRNSWFRLKRNIYNPVIIAFPSLFRVPEYVVSNTHSHDK